MADLRNFRNVCTKAVCVGRNYRAHAAEMGASVPSKPMLFVKTANSFVTENESIRIPIGCTHLSQEVELAVVIGKRANRVTRANAMDFVGGYALALDMTARDFQEEAKKAGAPWYLSKSFDTSCPVSAFIPKEKVPDPHKLRLRCSINGVEKQNSTTDKMIFDVPTLVEYVTSFVTLEVGDLVLTGTPEGVCKVNAGDLIECGLEGLITMKFNVIASDS